MQGVHDAFPADANNEEDPLSLRKLCKQEVMWILHKDVLGFTFDDVDKTIWLEVSKRDAIIMVMKAWIR